MYITSETELANLSLDLLSAGTVQDIVTPTSPTEEFLNRWYDQTRLKVLREHPWNFAAKRTILAASGTAPEFGFSTAFPVPSDFVRLLSLQDSGGNNLDSYNYEMEFVGDQRCILSSQESGVLRIRYVHDLKDVSKFDPLFIQLFAHELALVIAYKSTESNTNVGRINDIIKEARRIAKAVDGQERPPTMVRSSGAISARHNRQGRRYDRVVFDD